MIEKSFDNTRIILEYEAGQTKRLAKSVGEKILGSGALKSHPKNEHQEEQHQDIWNYLKEISIFINQRSCFIGIILRSLMSQKLDITNTISGYLKTMKEIHAMLIYKTAINSKDIFVSLSFVFQRLT